MSLRVAVYVRVSTLSQVETQTIEQQLERLHAYVQAHDWQLLDEHIFRDDGYSGAKLNRPGLDRLRDVVRTGDIDRMLVTEPSRLSRNYVHQMVLLEELERSGCQVEFLDRPMSQDPHDRLLLQIRGAVAEYERTLITERMRRGRLAKYRAGVLLPWSRAPYGYRLSPDRPRDPSGVRVDEAEAAVVREIFAWYEQEHTSLQGLAKHLQDQGIPTPSGKTIWSLCTLRAILRQPAYLGQVYAARYTYRPSRIRRSATHPMGRPHDSIVERAPEEWILVANVPALVTQQQFDRVQAKLAHNQSFATRHNTSHQYLLRALVSCGVCQSSCTARALQGGYRYYVCAAKANPIHSRKETKCSSRFSPAQQLDELVWQDLCHVLTHPETIAHALERAQGGQWLPQELQARRENLRKARVHLDQHLNRLTDAYLSEVMPLEEYKRRRHELDQKILGLESQEKQLAAQADRRLETISLVNSVEDFCRRVQTGLMEATFEQKRQLVELLVDRVVVKDGEVEIRYVIPTSPTSEHVRFCHLRSDYFRDEGLVRRRRLELLVEDVVGHRLVVLRVGSAHEAARGLGTDGVQAHQALDALVVAAFACLTQFGRDARAAVRLTTRPMHPADPLDQALVVPRPLAGGTLAPGVVAAGRDTYHPTQVGHRKLLAVLGDEGVSHPFGWAKIAIAFLRISRSVSSTSIWRRSRRSSASLSLRLPLPGKASTPSCLSWRFQACNWPG